MGFLDFFGFFISGVSFLIDGLKSGKNKLCFYLVKWRASNGPDGKWSPPIETSNTPRHC